MLCFTALFLACHLAGLEERQVAQRIMSYSALRRTFVRLRGDALGRRTAGRGRKSAVAYGETRRKQVIHPSIVMVQ